MLKLNRPPAVNSTCNSSNTSNVSYKKKDSVQKAQMEYNKKLDLEQFHDSKADDML